MDGRTIEDKEATLKVLVEVLNANYCLPNQKRKAREDARHLTADSERGRAE